jgi:L-asparaginase II
MHSCSRCRKTPDETTFYYRKSGKPQSFCVACQKDATIKRYAEKRDAIAAKARARAKKLRATVNKLKEVPCADCGHRYPPYVMDFDHLEDKQFNIGCSMNLGEKRVLSEIEKCDRLACRGSESGPRNNFTIFMVIYQNSIKSAKVHNTAAPQEDSTL